MAKPSNMNARTIKVEKTGDYFYAKVKPAIRLKGRWLEQAGFPPNSHARITVLADGVLQIQAITPSQPV